MRKSRRTELLVDADNHSIEQIREAMKVLRDDGQEVRTTVFAPPGRVENKKWGKFLQEPGIAFEPVLRRVDIHSEPNDKAIQAAMRAFATRDKVVCIALVTRDKDFVDLMVELQDLGTSMVVLIPEDMHQVIRQYRYSKVPILKLPATKLGTPVRAVLDTNGDGSVHMADPYTSFDNSAKAIEVMTYLKELHFRAEKGYLIQSIAKFWFVNRLGSLIVFPPQLATLSAYDVMQSEFDDAESYSGDLAFFLPVCKPGKNTQACRQIYGSTVARQIFKGGGPFMLQDSADLAADALRRLGYLDDDLNYDLAEALFCFINAPLNKQLLRKSGFLPPSGATKHDVVKKIRAAFLSHDHSGQWNIRTQQNSVTRALIKLLQSANLIGNADYGPTEVMEAMKIFSDQHGLPKMHTFNGLAVRILRSLKASPDQRACIELDRC